MLSESTRNIDTTNTSVFPGVFELYSLSRKGTCLRIGCLLFSCSGPNVKVSKLSNLQSLRCNKPHRRSS